MKSTPIEQSPPTNVSGRLRDAPRNRRGSGSTEILLNTRVLSQVLLRGPASAATKASNLSTSSLQFSRVVDVP